MGTTAAELKLCTIQGIVRLCPPWHKGHRHTGHTGKMKAALTHTTIKDLELRTDRDRRKGQQPEPSGKDRPRRATAGPGRWVREVCGRVPHTLLWATSSLGTDWALLSSLSLSLLFLRLRPRLKRKI